MNENTQSTLKALFAGVLGAVIVLFFVIILKGIALDNMVPTSTVDNVQTTDVSTESSVGKIYDNSVYSVISVINLQKIEVDNQILQKYIDAQTNGEPTEQSIGSGFVYKQENGYYYAVTNNHVVTGSDELGVLTNDFSEEDTLIDAELVGTNELYDVAVIRFKTDKEIKPLEFADSSKIYPGEPVYAIGSPYGEDFKGSITSGIVSAPIRKLENNGQEMEYIQTDAAINPGNSGGPLLNSEGQVVGMNTLKIAEVEADNMGFSIPSNVVQEIIAEIEEGSTSSENSETEEETPDETLEGIFGNSKEDGSSDNESEGSRGLGGLLK